MGRGRITLAVTVAGMLLAATPAAATTFYASPSSTRATQPCATDTPCRLDYAMLAAGTGDDVSLAPGKYYDGGTNPWAGLPPVKNGMTVHGTSSTDAPVIFGHVNVNAVPFLEVQDGGTLRDVELRSDVQSKPGNFYGYTVQIDPGATADRVIARGTGVPGVSMTACVMLGGTILNSVCQGSGPGGVTAVGANSNQATSYVLRNVTAITTAVSGTGVTMGTFNKTVLMSARNVIARGTTNDVSVVANDPAGIARMSLEYSNWATSSTSGSGTHEVLAGAGNQTGPTAATPRFVNAAAGDFRQAAGSPTIDAGLTDAGNGALALGGLARALGLRTDMGAYEHVPAPTAITGAAANITDGGARLNGAVTPDGVATTGRFEYGITNAYGRTANVPSIAATAAPSTLVAANITGLAPDTTYHYRLVVTAGNVTSRGQDRTFRTLAIPAGGQANPAVVSALTIGKRWRLGKKLPQIGRKPTAPVGTDISFTLSKGARVTLSFSQRVKGRITKGRCRRQTSRNRGKRRCTLSIVRGKLSLAGYAGRNKLHFEGRISAGRRLKPGRYRLTITLAGSRSTKSAGFTIVP